MKKILLVIDMQNDFIDGALGTPEAVAIVENVKAKIRSYPREDVFATRDTHTAIYNLLPFFPPPCAMIVTETMLPQ